MFVFEVCHFKPWWFISKEFQNLLLAPTLGTPKWNTYTKGEPVFCIFLSKQNFYHRTPICLLVCFTLTVQCTLPIRKYHLFSVSCHKQCSELIFVRFFWEFAGWYFICQKSSMTRGRVSVWLAWRKNNSQKIPEKGEHARTSKTPTKIWPVLLRALAF